MATIKCNGDSELVRWRRERTSPTGAPYEMLLTTHCRLLYKQQRGGTSKSRRRGVTPEQAHAQAAMFRLTRV